MTAAFPVRHYLTEISGDGARPGEAEGRTDRRVSADAEQQISDARAQGVLEGRAAAEAEYAASLAAKDAAFEEKLASERKAWAVEEGARLSGLIAAGLQELEQRIAEQVGHILKPVFSERVRVAAVSSLSQILNEMLAKGSSARITVSGPADLLSALQARLGEAQAGMRFANVDDGVDLVVNVDDAVLETRIGAWMRLLEGDDAPGSADVSGLPDVSGAETAGKAPESLPRGSGGGE